MNLKGGDTDQVRDELGIHWLMCVEQFRFMTLLAAIFGATLACAEPTFDTVVQPFLKTHCVSCHGPEKSKGDIMVHDLDGDLSGGRELDRWEMILDMIESGEMPPDDEPQPDEAARQAVTKWMEARLRGFVEEANQTTTLTTRRLTNFEYENTMRDLLGVDLDLIENLPEDPLKPYHFNNTAEFMLIGMEQLDRYKDNARRALASTIVDPAVPKVHRYHRKWDTNDQVRGLASDEIGISGNRRNTAYSGMGIKERPETGEFLVRIRAAAILPDGFKAAPMRVMAGYGPLGLNLNVYNNTELGRLNLTNSADDPQWFEFRGRIENVPVRASRKTKRGIEPSQIGIFPENIYDNGRLNESPDPLALPRLIIHEMEFEGPIDTESWPPLHHKQILFESPLRDSDPDGYVRAVLDRFVSRAFRRPAAEEEIERFLKIYKILAAELETFEEAIRETLAMVLISPQFLYHTQTEDGSAEGYKIASQLSYFLWGSMPDAALFELASQGKLSDPMVIGEQVNRLLADSRSEHFIDNFTHQWLDIDKMKTVKINRSLYPMFLYMRGGEQRNQEQPRPSTREYMEAETIGFISELIRRNASAMQIVDSDFAMLNEPLAEHYGVDGVQGVEMRPVSIKPEHHLGGLLTHGSVLIGNGTGSAPHPIYRAVWLREAILGDEVKPPPADVPALEETAGESAANAATIKDALRLHRQKESCNDCHFRLDPWGIPFEQYNAIGRFQPRVPKEGVRVRGIDLRQDADGDAYREFVQTLYTVKIHANARVPHGPEVKGMADLKKHLLKTRSDDIAENLVRRFMTYALGRELTYRDRFAVAEIMAQTRPNDYRFQDLIVAICQSPAFRESQPRPDSKP